MISRRLFHAALALGLGLALGGCGSPQSGAPEKTAKPRIALIMKSLANEFFVTMANGAKAHQQAHAQDYDLILNGIKDERDLDQQAALVDQMVASGVKAIVIAPADSKALAPVCKRAMQAGVAVINIDNRFDKAVLTEAGVSIPFVGPDNRAGARKVGDYMATKLAPGSPVAILEGVATAFNAQQRQLGLEDAMKAAGMNIVGAQSAEWETEKANTVASAMLGEHPELKAILCGNDSMALGAVAAIKAAGKAGQVLVSGFDNISAAQEMLKDGRIVATADQHADQLAVFGIEYALNVLRGQAAAADKETPVDLITPETLAPKP